MGLLLDTIVLSLKPYEHGRYKPSRATRPEDTDKQIDDEIHMLESTFERVQSHLYPDCKWNRDPTWCPACKKEDALTLELKESDVYTIRGRCSNGCSTRALGEAITRDVQEHEDAHIRHEQQQEHNAIASNVSLKRLRNGQPAMPWIVDRILSDDALTLLVGESGEGKTFCAMLVAICVAAGIPLLGRSVTEARVLLVLLEGAQDDWSRRIEQLARGLGTTYDALDGQLDVYDERLHTDDPESYARLAKYAGVRKYKLIVIDNLTEIRSGAAQNAENSADAMGNAMRPLTQLAHDQHIGVLLLHHAGASGNLRGSTAIRQMCDEELRISKANYANDAIITITRGKSRRGDGLIQIRYRMIDVNDATGKRERIDPQLVSDRDQPTGVESPVPVDGAIDENDLTPRREMILEIVRATPGIGTNAVARDIKSRTGKSSSMRDVSADLKWLVDDGHIVVDDAKKYRCADDE